MSRKKKIIIAVLVVVVLGGVAAANLSMKRSTAITVNVEKIEKRDLESIVSASGKVQPKRKVSISAETSGKVVNLQVNEGDMVTKGQLLLQIDPRNLETVVLNREASLNTQRSQLDQMKAQTENLRIALRQAEDALQRAEGLSKQGLIPREQLERAQNDVKMRHTDLKVNEQAILTQQQRIKQEEANLENAKYDLNKVRIVSPITGLVTRRNIEEGETAVVGTMNNAGTVLLEIAEMSVIETEIEVDETEVPDIKIGQPAKVTIDAIPDKTFPGKVTEVGNSPIQAQGGAGGAQRATNFKVVVTIDGEVPGVRPGFTCTAVITTSTRQKAVSVPIQAMTLREVLVDQEGHIIRPPAPKPGERRPPPAPVEAKEGQTRKELEGVFTIQDNRAVFIQVKTGIAGEKYFEVLDGLKEGDQVITGPFQSVRGLKDGDEVKVEAAPGPRPRG
ncbi:MAG TPA: efflux RND transporter periplasmic adaptor subunit [Vicinamibacterales bacterium]